VAFLEPAGIRHAILTVTRFGIYDFDGLCKWTQKGQIECLLSILERNYIAHSSQYSTENLNNTINLLNSVVVNERDPNHPIIGVQFGREFIYE